MISSSRVTTNSNKTAVVDYGSSHIPSLAATAPNGAGDDDGGGEEGEDDDGGGEEGEDDKEEPTDAQAAPTTSEKKKRVNNRYPFTNVDVCRAIGMDVESCLKDEESSWRWKCKVCKISEWSQPKKGGHTQHANGKKHKLEFKKKKEEFQARITSG
jgi:hypothetical protein